MTGYEMRISDWSSDVCSSDLSNRLGDMMIPSHPSQARSCRAKSRHPSSKRKVDGCLELDDVGSNGHCERSEAISSSRCSMTVAGDCFASLAMTTEIADGNQS